MFKNREKHLAEVCKWERKGDTITDMKGEIQKEVMKVFNECRACGAFASCNRRWEILEVLEQGQSTKE